MFNELKKANTKALEVDSFLATLLAKHCAGGAWAQLKTLWIGHVSALLQEGEEAPVVSRAGGVGGVHVRAQTQPESQLPAAAGGAA